MSCAQAVQLMKLSIDRYRMHPLVAWVIALSPFLLVFGSIAFREDPTTGRYMRWVLSENRPVELLTFASLLIAGVLGCRLAWRTAKLSGGWLYGAFYAVFGVGLIFVAMEEISWGQWFLFYETPEAIKNINKQEEMNFHNLPAFHAAFEILRVAFGVGGLLGIACSFIKWTRPIGAPPLLVFWFAFIAILAALDVHNYYVDYTSNSIFGVAARQVELLELLIGGAALLYMWLNGRQLAHGEALNISNPAEGEPAARLPKPL